jgi:hypothetical protein
VDADHINLNNVAGFIEASDFFTIDVAESIRTPCNDADINAFVKACDKYTGTLDIPGMDQGLIVTPATVRTAASTFLGAVKEAARIYRTIVERKSTDAFITEVSMDETDSPQGPIELFFILGALAQEGVPVQTIAPKFSGRFNKGVDYVGDVAQFTEEFNQDVAVVEYAKQIFDLPDNLKLSVHSGSDKFSIYAPINRTLKQFNAGLHIKTAGTTWLEEIIGLAEADGAGLTCAQEVYAQAYAHIDALCAPYATVIDIRKDKLPAPDLVNTWDSHTFVRALRHDPACPDYNLHMRQLLHVGYKVAAHMGPRYLQALDDHRDTIARNVTENILNRHILPVFG